jgi:chorismate mutase/prephenate dehydratase
MNQDSIRQEIDKIDEAMVELFCKRMGVSEQIAQFKKENVLPVRDIKRERELLSRIMELAGDELAEYAATVYKTILTVSRSHQNTKLGRKSRTYEKITSVLEQTPNLFPQRATVACQGTVGAFSEIACEKLFKMPNIMYFNSFGNVFRAVESGMCQYGVLPIENSTAGSVNKIYDLMISHNFCIVRGIRLRVSHNLLAKRGIKLEDIKQIISHEQAINQCSDFLESLKQVTVTESENTATAAQLVAQSEQGDIAAIASGNCVDHYGLCCLKSSIQNRGDNFTRFICISKEPQIFPGADKTSIMMTLSHQPGTLSNVLTKFSTLGINLTKLESRPLPEREFEFMFYFDIEASVYSPEFERLFNDLESESESFRYLGTYSEIVG